MQQVIWGRNKFYELKGCLGCKGDVYLAYDFLTENWAVLKCAVSKSKLKWEQKMLSIYAEYDFVPDFLLWEKLALPYCRLNSLVLEYKEGMDLRSLLRQRVILTRKEIIYLACKMAVIFFKIHEKGYIYGDLKLEHLIYNEKTKSLSLIDFGSCTKKGKLISSYTPAYDRKNWGIGSRLADVQYDIFSFSVVLNRLQRNDDFFTGVILKGLKQEYESMAEVLTDLKKLNV